MAVDRLAQVLQPYRRLARHYGVPHVDMMGTLQQLVTDGVAAGLGMSPWRLTSEFFEMAPHVRRGSGLGGLLVADMLVTLGQMAVLLYCCGSRAAHMLRCVPRPCN